MKIKDFSGSPSSDGATINLNFQCEDGSVQKLEIEFAKIGRLFLEIKDLSIAARNLQKEVLSGVDPMLFHQVSAMEVTRFRGGTSAEGKPALHLEVNGGISLVFGLQETQIQELIEYH